MNKLRLKALIILLTMSTANGGSDIGKVYGEKTWIAYVGSGKGIFIKIGSTSFKSSCDTGFVLKDGYVMGPDGSSYRSNSSVLTAIQRYLVRGKYKSHGCR